MELKEIRKYKSPEIIEIKIDTDISMAMESSPPDNAPGETMNNRVHNTPYPTI